ncbi:hypothetical protein SAMN05216404_106242 [Nitrosospira multiformis]|uniref:Uncharacterized protein n=1 Tax=Nitrosospira multiformis TaxID=1231 RepID=A0A1H8IZ25_9PROT|nr:hypothetical protein SAMN05216404_106242 [Nitrosospira multiformis]
MEHYRRGNLDYFFAYPEDYADTCIEWEEDGLRRSARHPAFEIIFVYSHEEGKISLYMKGSRDTRKDVRALFADAILGLELGEFVEDQRVYDLSPLQDSSPPFLFSPDSGIENVVIRKLRLGIDGKRKRLTLEVNPDKNPNAIYEFRDQLCRNIPPSQITITQAGIVVDYTGDAKSRKTRTRSFDITPPNSCSLKHEGIDAIIRQMLVDSGIEPRAR